MSFIEIEEGFDIPEGVTEELVRNIQSVIEYHFNVMNTSTKIASKSIEFNNVLYEGKPTAFTYTIKDANGKTLNINYSLEVK